jgi:hypothetical protein
VVGDAQVMQDAREEDEFVVVVHTAAQAVGSGQLAGEQVAAGAVVGDEPGRYVERQFDCR